MELNYRKKFQDNSWFLNEILIFIKATYQKCDSTRMVKILEGKRLIFWSDSHGANFFDD